MSALEIIALVWLLGLLAVWAFLARGELLVAATWPIIAGEIIARVIVWRWQTRRHGAVGRLIATARARRMRKGL